MVAAYTERMMDRLLSEVFVPTGLGGVMLTGPRGCGKTTTALRHVKNTVRLDAPGQAAAFSADPDVYLAALELPVLIDEWQEVPESMGAVKRAIDQSIGGGRFLIAGSVRARRTGNSWPGTGRVVPLRMYGLTAGEIAGYPDGVQRLERLFDENNLNVGELANAPTIRDYVSMLCRGGFPEVINMTPRQRALWYPGYIDQLIHRDVADLAEVRSPERLSALLTAIAAIVATTPTIDTLAQAASLDGRTTRRYLDLLADIGILVQLPSWQSNELKRLTKAPKLHLSDPALAANILRLDEAAIFNDGPTMGRLLEDFVAMQIVPPAALSVPPITVSHLRTEGGTREIDFILEGPRREIVGIEVKAGVSVTAADAKHLAWFRDEIGSRFRTGIVLHTGSGTFQISDRIWAMPIAKLWLP